MQFVARMGWINDWSSSRVAKGEAWKKASTMELTTKKMKGGKLITSFQPRPRFVALAKMVNLLPIPSTAVFGAPQPHVIFGMVIAGIQRGIWFGIYEGKDNSYLL